MRADGMKGLIGLNAALLGVLALVTLAPGAEAQARRARPKGQYSVVDGRMQGSTEAGLFVLDTANQEMIVVRWDRSRKSLTLIGHRDLALDSEQAQKGGR